MRLTSRLLNLASEASLRGASPKNVWLRTKAPGVYVRPEETDGQVWVYSEKLVDRSSDVIRTTYWDSTCGPEEMPVIEVDLHDRRGIALPGLQIMPEEIEKMKSQTMHVRWDRKEVPGIQFSFSRTRPTGSKPIELMVFLHHSRVAKVSLDTIHKVMQYKSATAKSKLHVIQFKENSLVQCYPFKKGFALRFINCGTGVRTRVKAKVQARPWLYQKTMYVHLPESDEVKHEAYEPPDRKNGIDGDGKTYGRHHKDMAKQNERVFQDFLDGLRIIMGEAKVVLCDEEPEDVAERESVWKST